MFPAVFAFVLLLHPIYVHPASPPPGSCSTDADCPPDFPCCSTWGNCGNVPPWCPSSPPPPPPPCKSPLYGTQDGGALFDDGASQGVVKVKIISGCVIDAVQVQVDNGEAHDWLELHGTKSNANQNQIDLDYPNEYIYKISGYTGQDTKCGAGWAKGVITRLSIHTKKKDSGKTETYGPYGASTSGTPFESSEGNVLGFWGYASTDAYMKGIGVYFEGPCPSNSSIQSF